MSSSPRGVGGRWPASRSWSTAVALVAALLVLTGYASSPFAVLFALIAVAAALGFGPRAGLAAAALSTIAFGAVLLLDPALATYTADDALRLSFGLGATWLLVFVAVAYADRQRRAMRRAIDLSRTDPLTNLFNRSQLFVDPRAGGEPHAAQRPWLLPVDDRPRRSEGHQ